MNVRFMLGKKVRVASIDQGYAAADFAAGDTVVTSSGDMDFTILLNGVTSTDLVNENFAGIA